MDYKWSGLEQKWIGSRKLNFLPNPTEMKYVLTTTDIIKSGDHKGYFLHSTSKHVVI